MRQFYRMSLSSVKPDRLLGDVRFKTKPQIALDQIRAAHAAGVAPGIVLADAGYGANSDFRAGVSALNLPYVAGIQSTPSVWSPGQAPLPPKRWSGRGQRPCNVQRDDQHKPVSVKELALSLGKKAWRSVTWREGSNAPLASRFAAVRVHLAARDYKRTTPASGRMAARRMAEGRGGSHEILAFYLARGHAPRHTRRLCQTALAYRETGSHFRGSCSSLIPASDGPPGQPQGVAMKKCAKVDLEHGLRA